MEQLIEKNAELEAKNAELEAKLADVLVELEGVKGELDATKEHLKRYTAPKRCKAYYEKNKEAIMERNRKYSSTKEQRKEYNKRSYFRRKEKIKMEQELVANGENV